jgi:hypothetical protein
VFIYLFLSLPLWWYWGLNSGPHWSHTPNPSAFSLFFSQGLSLLPWLAFDFNYLMSVSLSNWDYRHVPSCSVHIHFYKYGNIFMWHFCHYVCIFWERLLILLAFNVLLDTVYGTFGVFCFVLFCFCDRVLLYNPGWFQTYFVAQASLEPVTILGLRACTTMPILALVLSPPTSRRQYDIPFKKRLRELGKCRVKLRRTLTFKSHAFRHTFYRLCFASIKILLYSPEWKLNWMLYWAPGTFCCLLLFSSTT